MTSAIAPVSALLLSVAFLLAGNGLQGTLLPIRAGMEAFSTPDIGVLGSAYYIGFASGCLLGGRIPGEDVLVRRMLYDIAKNKENEILEI